MKQILVIGATGDVGRGIVEACVGRGHCVAAAARNAGRLGALADSLGGPERLQTLCGSLASEEEAQALLRSARATLPALDGVVISVNAPRQPAGLLSFSPGDLAAILQADLITHYTAARTFVPALVPGGVLIGIGGGSCDFVLQGGIPQSVAQAGLRMLYRGLALEFADRPVALRELIIASVVNGLSVRAGADPLWVTDREIGEHVADILQAPEVFPGPIRRIARRDASGRPVLSAEPPSRVQGFR